MPASPATREMPPIQGLYDPDNERRLSELTNG